MPKSIAYLLEEVPMSIDRAELANALAEATGWSVSADPRRFTFVNDDPRVRTYGQAQHSTEVALH